MATLTLIIHIIVCISLILIVLLQSGKGASMGAVFGGSSQTIFGSSGATTFLTKLTTVVAVVFMITSLMLAFMHGPRISGSSVVGPSSQAAQKQSTPAQVPAALPANSGQATPAKPAAK
jgi:preprotein translocase subunit SecG